LTGTDVEAATDKLTYFSFYETSANTGHMLQEQMGGDALDNKLQRTDNALGDHHTLFFAFLINGIIYRLKHPAHREAL